MKQHQNSPSCKCSNQDSKQLILSRLRERGRELVCQGLQNYQASGVHSRNFIVFHNGRGEALSNGFPSQELALKFSKPSPTQHCSGFLSSHGLQTAARPSSQRYGTIQPRRVKCKLPWQLTLPMMISSSFVRSFLPSGDRWSRAREKELVLRLCGTEIAQRWAEKARNSAIGLLRGAESRGEMRDWRTNVRDRRESTTKNKDKKKTRASKSQGWHECLHGNTFWKWGSRLVVKVGSNKLVFWSTQFWTQVPQILVDKVINIQLWWYSIIFS